MDRGERFAAAMAAITRRLPFGLADVIAPSVVGYVLINVCTFCVDLLLLALFHGIFKWPLPVSVTLSYGTAGVISYIANRVFNFRSHGNVGKQVPMYAAAMASNYLIFVLGLTDLLAYIGVYFEVSRFIAACCEGVYLYSCMRWIVFRDAAPAPGSKKSEEPGDGEEPGGGEPGDGEEPANREEAVEAAGEASRPVPRI